MALLEGSSGGQSFTSTSAGTKQARKNRRISSNLMRAGRAAGSASRRAVRNYSMPKQPSRRSGSSGGSSRGFSNGGSRPSSSFSGGFSGPSNYSGSPIGNNASGTIAKPAKPRMSQGQFLAQDATFKSQQNAYKKAIDDYLAQYSAEQQKYNTEFGAATDKLGLERTQGAEELENDYAGRGLLQSGVYADALNEFNTGYDTRLADMSRAKSNYMADLLTGKNNFQQEQKLMTDKARQDAINRYMASIGV